MKDIMRVGTSTGSYSRHALGLAILACLLGIGLSIMQVALAGGPDLRLRAVRSVAEFDRQHFSDPWPSIRTAMMLAENSRTEIYDSSQTSGPAFIYPPIAALMYRPLIGLERDDIFRVLSIFNRMLYAGIHLLLLSLLAYKRRLTGMHILGLGLITICFYPLARAVQLNQATLLVSVFLGGGWVALQRGRASIAGVLLALAAAIKPQLILILPVMFWHSRRLVYWALGTGGVLLAISVVYAGIQNHLDYFTAMLPAISPGYSYFPNQSFNGLFNRMFLAAPIDQFGVVPFSGTVRMLTLGAGAATYLTALGIARRLRDCRESTVGLFGFGWLIATLVSPVSWEHHYAPALFVFVWLARQYDIEAGKPPIRLLWPSVVAFILIGGYFDIFPLAARGVLWPASYVLYGGVLLAVVIACLLLRQAMSKPSESGAAEVAATHI